MSDYSFLQRTLHKLVLGPRVVREATFEIENFFEKKIKFKDDHIFITGLARSGSTVLLNAIYNTDKFSSLCYSDMPFILSPNLWSKLSFGKHFEAKERAHGDGIEISTNSPEAFEEVFWKTFKELDADELSFNFHKFVKRVIQKNAKERYLSKNNQNIKRLEVLREIFPHSKIIIPFRDPVQQAFSLLNQHKRFIEISKKDPFVASYMALIGHTEFGPCYSNLVTQGISVQDRMDLNHWLEQWFLVYEKCLKLEPYDEHIILVNYEKLCSDPSVWRNLQRKSGIVAKNKVSFKNYERKIDVDLNINIIKECKNIFSKMLELSI